MPTVEQIITGLNEQRAEHLAAGRYAEVQRVDQELIAYQTLLRLFTERDAHRAAGEQDALVAVEQQISYWVRQVDLVDVDQEHADADVDAPAPVAVDQPAGTGTRRPPKRAE
ncbi:hypothetical protein GA0074692_6800 [Micromonospora pallida]|uniref:Uncharacterized protein n=1 Tax=Micromonospora pallida TaxID=145854 RepID=A0A1C6TNG1_9ACTN|nr:hypothetical protein [Micromonospora pallida]SCL43163.1 hypothetical protein GA0074692_6742 [Micromonospora pallida]SCL43274.1 hypothetical protein GA0074692_6800 [Micromonospora pallida]